MVVIIIPLGLVLILVLPSSKDDPARTGGPDPAPPPAPLSSPAPNPSDGGTAATGWNDLGCNGTKGSTETPTLPPKATWEPVGAAVAPSSADYGPSEVSGFVRTCYQHSPTGALFAALNIVSAIAAAPSAERTAVIEAGMTAGEYRDEALSAPPGELGWKIAAFHVEGCSAERCNLVLVVSAKGSFGTLNVPLIWAAGDWRVDGTRNAGGGGLESVPPGYVSWGA
ncbi:hypothetical protein [Pimelobacter simplex]|uniref:hypothetical protein n=1 Tax=Nocardioides simplex TaxID=2045 RepID=UPI00214F9DC8|nr:hypothetical protein [Pimelobacter simplex]UUW93022.1 hypothetical protein M0M43_30480 [Pimelobacter simplex]UUW99055.1 hypothetical protein M0M48_30500 [Pimelobacter simplex]